MPGAGTGHAASTANPKLTSDFLIKGHADVKPEGFGIVYIATYSAISWLNRNEGILYGKRNTISQMPDQKRTFGRDEISKHSVTKP